MGDNNVASIGKMLMQTQSGQSVTGVDGADIGTTFRKMVDQMTQIPGSSVSTGSQTAQNMQQLTPHSPEQNYDRYQYQKNKTTGAKHEGLGSRQSGIREAGKL